MLVRVDFKVVVADALAKVQQLSSEFVVQSGSLTYDNFVEGENSIITVILPYSIDYPVQSSLSRLHFLTFQRVGQEKCEPSQESACAGAGRCDLLYWAATAATAGPPRTSR